MGINDNDKAIIAIVTVLFIGLIYIEEREKEKNKKKELKRSIKENNYLIEENNHLLFIELAKKDNNVSPEIKEDKRRYARNANISQNSCFFIHFLPFF